MFDAQIDTLKKLDELMTKVGGSMNDNILPYFGQHEVDGLFVVLSKYKIFLKLLTYLFGLKNSHSFILKN